VYEIHAGIKERTQQHNLTKQQHHIPQLQFVTKVSTWEIRANRKTSWIFSKLRYESFGHQAEILIPE
jgi:hypothetical protein